MWGISWVAEELLAFQEGLCSLYLVILISPGSKDIPAPVYALITQVSRVFLQCSKAACRLKYWWPSTRLDDVVTQKTALWIYTVFRIWKVVNCLLKIGRNCCIKTGRRCVSDDKTKEWPSDIIKGITELAGVWFRRLSLGKDNYEGLMYWK